MGSDSGVFISLVFYVIFGAITLLPYFIRKTSLKALDPLQPYLVISALLFIYTISTLRGFEATGLAEALESVSSYSVVKYALACLVGQFGLAMGELVGPATVWDAGQQHKIASDDVNLRLLLGPGLVLGIAALPFYVDRFDVFNVASYADAAFESRVVRSLDVTAGVKDVFLRDMPASLLLCACTALLFDGSRLFVVRLGAAAAIGAYALASLLAGWRGQLVAVALLPFMYYHYRVRKVSLVLVALVGVSGYILVNAISVARSSSDPAEMIALLTEQIGTEGFGFLEITQSGELQTSTNLVRLIVGIDTGEDAYRWGEVVASNILSTVPRVFWPDRPPTGSELFVQVFYPGVLESGGGYGSFIFQDPYWDFGFFGVFLFALGLAWAMRKVYAALIVDRGTAFSVLLYALIYGFMFLTVIRGGIFAGIKGALIPAIPLLLIAAIARFAPAQASVERSNVR